MQMKRLGLRYIGMLIMGFWLLAGMGSEVQAASYRGADVAAPGNGDFFLDVEGTYVEINTQAVVNRINAMRQEAYNEGLISQYTPVQWDYGLDYIAQYRAVEAGVYYSHNRPNGKSNSTMKYNGYSTPT